MIILAIYFTIPGFNPPAFQRISMGKDIPQVVQSWSIAAIHLTFFTLSVSFIGWMLFLMNPNLAGNEMLAYLVDNYLFTGLKGILIVGIMAMIMSTADSFLNIGSVLIANDCYRIHTLSESTKLMYARFWTLIIGFISIIIASFDVNLLPIILTTASFYMPIVSVPLIFTIFGYRSTERCVLIAMGTGFLTVASLLLLDYLDIFSLKPLVPGMLINAIFLVSSHFLLEKRKMYTGLNDDGYFEEYKYIHSNKLYRAKYWFFNTMLRQAYNDDILLAFLQRELGNNTVKLNEKKFIKEYGLNKENYYNQIKRLEKLRWIIRNDNGLKILKNGNY
jgi:Na+/proline symporter